MVLFLGGGRLWSPKRSGLDGLFMTDSQQQCCQSIYCIVCRRHETMVDLTAADLKVALNIDRIESEEGKGSYDVE